MIGDKTYMIEFRIIDGIIQSTFRRRDFVADGAIEEWPWFRVFGSNKNIAIDEIIAKLNSLKDEE